MTDNKNSDQEKTSVDSEQIPEEKTTFDTLSKIHNLNDSIALPDSDDDTKFEILTSSVHQFEDQNTLTKDLTSLTSISEEEKSKTGVTKEVPTLLESQFKTEPLELNADNLFSDLEYEKEDEVQNDNEQPESTVLIEVKNEKENDFEPLDIELPNFEEEVLSIEPQNLDLNSEIDEINLPTLDQDDLPELDLEALKPTDEEDLSRSLMQQEEISEKDFFQDIATKSEKKKTPKEVFDQIKKTSAAPVIQPIQKDAIFPFTLCIDGQLESYEKELLLDILGKFNLGIREMDLQPQFDSERILLPRISEYACIYIAQHLRDAKVTFKLGPSDEIFNTPDTKNDFIQSKIKSKIHTYTQEEQLRASKIPLYQGHTHPEGKKTNVLGSLSVSHTIHSPHESQIKRSDDYAETLESLTKELQHKAYYKGADLILNFTVSLQPLKSPGLYKMLLLGVAVKTLPINQE